MPAELDGVAYLETKGYSPSRRVGAEVRYPCFFECGEPAGSRKRKLYLNVEDGVYYCFVCGASGGTYLLQKHFGDEPKGQHPSGEDPYVRRRILGAARDIGVQLLRGDEDVLLYLLSSEKTKFGPGRALSVETLLERGLGYIGNGWSLVDGLREGWSREELRSSGLVFRDGLKADQDFYWDHVLIPYVSHGHVVQIRGRLLGHKGSKYISGPGEKHLFYNVDDLDEAEDVVLTESELDAISLKQMLASSPEDMVRRIGVLGMAGTNGMPAYADKYLEHVKRIYIAFDSDDAGMRAAIKLKEQVGSRARVVELPRDGTEKTDWNELLRRGYDWRRCMELIGSSPGKRVFSMREAGAAFRAAQRVHAGYKTGYIGLDAVLLPGLLPGQVTVILAKTGVGKTILLCNLAYNMRHTPMLFASLEMTREEVYDRLRKIYLFHHPGASDEKLEQALHNIMICDENRLSERDLAALIDEYEMERGVRPEVVMVDYLGYFARGVRGSNAYEKTTNAVMTLKALAKSDDPARRVHVIAPHQVNRMAKEGRPIDMDDARDAGTVEETADFLLSIFRPDDAMLSDDGPASKASNPPVNQYASGKLKLAVLKSRHGGKGRCFTLLMDQLTLAIVDVETAEARRAVDHNYLYWRGENWEAVSGRIHVPTQSELVGANGHSA